MDTAVSIDSLVRKLENILCGENKGRRKYAKAWLTQEDFGGLYEADKYVLNMQAEHQIESCFDETRTIITLLNERLESVEVGFIWRVVVYNANEEIHCWSEDIEIRMNAVC